MVISLAVAAVFFVLGCYAQIAGFHFSVAAVAKNAGAPLVALASPGAYGSVWLAQLVELVILLDTLAVYIGVSVSVTRGVATMAKDGWLPKPLARFSARRGTPIGATIVVAVTYLVTVLVSEAWPNAVAIPGLPGYFDWYAWLSGFGIFCLAAIYFAVCVCVGAPRGPRGQLPVRQRAALVHHSRLIRLSGVMRARRAGHEPSP